MAKVPKKFVIIPPNPDSPDENVQKSPISHRTGLKVRQYPLGCQNGDDWALLSVRILGAQCFEDIKVIPQGIEWLVCLWNNTQTPQL